jgi:predicted transport protein
MEVQHFKTKLNYATVAANNKQLQLEINLQLQMEEQFINQAQKKKNLYGR